MKLGQDRFDGKLEDRQVDIFTNLAESLHPLVHGCIFVADRILKVEEIDLALLL